MRRPAKITREIIGRYKLIRAIHTCYYTQLDANVVEFSTEFFYLVGDILEGKPIDEGPLRCIDMQRVREFLKEDK
jgi:hypothetical protein